MKKIFELYKEIKAKHPEHLLLIGDGDCYFLFEKDAVAGNKCLGTDMHSWSDIAENPVNIVEFPHHCLDAYLPRLVRDGYKVAVCDTKDLVRYKTTARVKVLTEAGKWYLAEIKGLKEGTIVEGIYNPLNRAFDFYWNGEGAMLWIGENGELINE